jgi:ankyrin repeat protein
MAATEGHESVVTLLLDAKADVNYSNSVRHSLLHLLLDYREEKCTVMPMSRSPINFHCFD